MVQESQLHIHKYIGNEYSQLYTTTFHKNKRNCTILALHLGQIRRATINHLKQIIPFLGTWGIDWGLK